MSMTQSEIDQLAERIACIIVAKMTAKVPAAAPLLIDKFELSKRTTLSVSSIERRVKDGTLPAIKSGRRLMFSPDAVLTALSKTVNRNASESTPMMEAGK